MNMEFTTPGRNGPNTSSWRSARNPKYGSPCSGHSADPLYRRPFSRRTGAGDYARSSRLRNAAHDRRGGWQGADYEPAGASEFHARGAGRRKEAVLRKRPERSAVYSRPGDRKVHYLPEP